MGKGLEPPSIGQVYLRGINQQDIGVSQDNLPFFPRTRLLIWGNYKLLMKAEYLFFYIPTVIIFGLAIPIFATIYTAEEIAATTMTVKVTGRQWYWVYEVESPTDDDDE